jgi:pilus assembly protein CpaC
LGFGAQGNLQLGITPAGFFGTLRALQNEGIAKFLSEPKVVTQSGRPAFIQSGGEQAVLGETAGGLGSISVERVPIGTTLEVLPLVYGNGKIYLTVRPTVRSVNNALGLATQQGFSPGFNLQSTEASVMLESGQTFAIGGLLENTVQASASRVPVLGSLPYIGAAFSTVSHEERERELIILVTPRLVDALDCTQVPKRVPGRETRNPDDYELFLEGLLEAPRGQRQVWNGRCYNAAWKCDPNGLFPCKGDICTGPGGCGASGCATGGCGTTAPAMHVNPQPLPPAPTPVQMPVAGTTELLPQTVAPVEATDPQPLPPVVPVIPGGVK